MGVKVQFMEWKPRIFFLGELYEQKEKEWDTFIFVIEKLVEKEIEQN